MLDKKDLAIIAILREDARTSVREIAKLTGIKPSTVHQRIRKLIESKVIEKFTIKLDNKAINENFIVFMLVKVKPDTKILIQDKHIKEVFNVTGNYDLLLKLKFGCVEEFNQFITRFKQQYKVDDMLTMVATSTLKEDI